MRKLIGTGFALLLGLSFAASPARAADKKTERVWRANCASCHGNDGKAATEKGKKEKILDMTSAAWQKSATDDDIRTRIMKGVKKTEGGVTKEMDPFGDKLSPAQVDALVKFVRDFGK